MSQPDAEGVVPFCFILSDKVFYDATDTYYEFFYVSLQC